MITFPSINMSTKLGKNVMWPCNTTFLEWHLDINKRICQSITENKTYTVQNLENIFEWISFCYEVLSLQVITAEVKVFKICAGTLRHVLARKPWGGK